jgi:hypothetical protein
MNFRTTAALFGTLFGLLWLFGLMLALKPGYQDMGYVFPGLNDNPDAAVDAVEIDRTPPGKDRERYLFAKTADGWTLKLPGQNETIKVEGDKVEQMISQLREARKNDEATEVFNDPPRYGLDRPAAEVTLKDQAKGKEWKLSVGRQSPDKNYYYVGSSERPGQVMAVRDSAISSVMFKNVNELRSRKLLDVTDTNTSFVDLKGKKDGKPEEVTLKKTEEGDWVFVTPPYGAAEAGSAAIGLPAEGSKQEPGVRGLLSSIGALRVDSEDDFEAPGKKLSEFGLEEGKETLRVTAEHSEGFASKKTVKQSLLVGSKFGDKYYARLAGDNTVVRLDAKKLEPISQVLNNPKSLRSTDLAKLDPHAPDAIDLRHGKGLAEVVKLRRPSPTLWELLVDKEPVRKANLTAVEGDKGLLEALQGKKQVKEFFDVAETDPAKRKAEEEKLDAKLGLTPAAAVAQVAVYVKGLEKPAAKGEKEKEKDKDKADEKKSLELKKDAKPVLTLTFGKSEGGQVYVKREPAEGSASRVAVPAEILEKVMPPQGWLAFLDPSLSPFTADDATRLKLVRSDGTFEVEKDAKKNEWTLQIAGEKGTRKADAGQVGGVLQRLAALTVKKWVKRTTDKKELEGFGLLKPALVAEVTLKKKDDAKPTIITYEFGKESETDKPAVYARQAGSDLVFLAPEGDFKALQTAELRDRTIYDFDASKVKEIELTIRKDVTLKPVFARDKSPGSWVVKSGLVEFTLDPARVEEFVKTLSKLQAERFVSFKGATAEQGLAPDKAALVVKLIMDDGKTTHTLTVGAKDKEGDYYAMADTHPGTVFLLGRGRFDPIMTGVSYFSKK